MNIFILVFITICGGLIALKVPNTWHYLLGYFIGSLAQAIVLVVGW